jgi:response regulator RpfG family c-di-GMP phosphodiesterase
MQIYFMDYKILVVDDEPANLRMLERLFRSKYKVVSAASGPEALELLTQHDIALIISDQRMPGMTGIEFLKRAAKEMRPSIVRIILTGYTDVNALVEAINSGVIYKYVTKPWVNEDLQQTVVRALEHYETIKNQHELKLQNERLQARLKITLDSFVKATTNTLKLKDPYMHEHVHRIANYVAAIGRRLNMNSEELEQLSLAAFLHETPHIDIPNHILHKTTEMTEEEFRIFLDAFDQGLQMLASVPDLEDVSTVVRYQHEHFDGSGFPEGLSGEQIPLHARIIAAADAYDKMIFPRSLQSIWEHNGAVKQLHSDAGKKFDPNVVEVINNLESINQIS